MQTTLFKQTFIALVILGVLIHPHGATEVFSYPLDGAQHSGINRLAGYTLIQQKKIKGQRLSRGALLSIDKIDLQLLNNQDFSLAEADAHFTEQVVQLLGDKADGYAVAIVDLSTPDKPRVALHRDDIGHNPGSVGKLLVALALFQTLADIYPHDEEARNKTLKGTSIRAGTIIKSDHHKVPIWHGNNNTMEHRPIQQDDMANLWTYLDWMLSASSNAAASVVIRETLLLRHFGKKYPVPDEDTLRFLNETPRRELSDLLIDTLQSPITRNGLSLKELRQGGFFTREGKNRIPGSNSTATARELMEFLLLLEQGRLVDEFSSRELKRLLYMTQRRIRYSSSPALYRAAVYFKSGSYYKCRKEPEFKCRKYQGNVFNLMNSVAIIESPAKERQLHYLVVVMSNVLRKNSAVDHQTLATQIHQLIEENRKEKLEGERKKREGRRKK